MHHLPKKKCQKMLVVFRESIWQQMVQKMTSTKNKGHVSPLHAFAVILATRTEVFSDNEKV